MSSRNNNQQKEIEITRWYGRGLVVVIAFVFTIFLIRLVTLQNTNVEEIELKHIARNYRIDTLRAARGNLYATDGSILATTVMRYDVHLDFKSMTKKPAVYTQNIDALTDSLSRMFGKPKHYYRKMFDEQKEKQNQYFLLVRGLDFDEFDRIRKFPIFQKGKSKGGFIVDRRFKRELATSEIGAGTIGMDDHRGKSGLEAAFSKYLAGKDGTRFEQRINSKQWKPIDYWKINEPVDGQDVYTTLDLRIQDIAKTALVKQLQAYDAEYGTVVVMEVKTGKVRALVNLRIDKNGEYHDAYNYAIRDNIEPGSTFKVVSLLTAIDDGYIDANTTVDVGERQWIYKEQKITDDHPEVGKYDISSVLAKSSNIGTVKLLTKYYGAKQEVFLNHLKRWKLFDKMELEIPGSSTPKFVTPQHSRWNAAGIASITYGYNVDINVLQLATFYNGIANKGVMVKPLFIDKIKKDGQLLYEATPQVLVPKMASDEAINLMTKSLIKAVEKGTARSIFTPNLKMAGKTGTARYNYGGQPGGTKYRASFAGFYPADNPMYTCFVIINNPNQSKSYYGGKVAAPVFKEIAGKTFLKTPQNIEKEMLGDKAVSLAKLLPPQSKVSIKNSIMPEMKGMAGRDAIALLENAGYRTAYTGVGKVKDQLPLAGIPLKKGQRVYLTLEK